METHAAEKSSARIGVLVALVLVAVVLVTVWYREGDAGSLHRIRTGVHAAAAPFGVAGEFVTRPIRGVGGWFGGFGLSRQEVEALREQNAKLRVRNAELEEARLQNERLRELVALVEARELAVLGARVISRPTNAWEGVITIDVGTDDGVAPGMPVVAPDGLLGQTIGVTGRSAKVRLITDQRSGVAAMVQQGRSEGIARGAIDGGLTLDFVSVDATVTSGDVVITSGMGGVFPKGLLIGEVAEATNNPGDLDQTIVLSPAADLGRLEEVAVLVGAPSEDAGVNVE